MTPPPPLIIGAGPAGSAAAIILSRSGVAPRLIERRRESQAGVCGGFLGWSGIAALRALGVDAWALGAQPISRFRFVAGARQVEASLPFTAAGISRRTLDAALLRAAEEAGAAISLGRAVRAAEAGGRRVRLDNGEELDADALFLATGKHELRGLPRSFTRSSAGLRTSLPVDGGRSEALRGVVEMHLFNDGYAGLLLQDDGSANLCLSVGSERLSQAGGVPALLAQLMDEAPCFAERLGGKVPLHFDAVAGVPYGWRARRGTAGLFRIGDQGAVTASLAGDGIAIALASGMNAARAFIQGGPQAAVDWQRSFFRQSRAPIGVAEALRHGAASPAMRAVIMAALQWMPRIGTQAAKLTRFVRA